MKYCVLFAKLLSTTPYLSKLVLLLILLNLLSKMGKTRSAYRKKRKFYGNQFEKNISMSEESILDGESSMESTTSNGDVVDEANRVSDVVGPSASAKKITIDRSGSKISEEREKVNGFCLIDTELLSQMFLTLPCKNCFEFHLELSEDPKKRKGLASCLVLCCTSCGWENEFFTSQRIGCFFEVNRRFVYGMRSIGCGSLSAKRFCGFMNMPAPPRATPYSSHNKSLLKAVKEVSSETMSAAAKEISDLKGTDTDAIADCRISCDGTWQRRGYQSLNGCVTVISMDTGKVLDVESLSKVCKTCQKHGGDDESSAAYLAWKADHIPKCQANYKGSAPAMEPEGATRIFKRSKDKNKLRYNEFYGDGDSKSFAAVKDVYNDDNVTVVKKECVGHVQKRLGTALRKLKKGNKGMGGKGRLTDAMIDKLQNYYGIAIRSNSGNLAAMKKAIHATLFHCASSEHNNWHTYCPEGEDSWCSFQRDKACNTNDYKPGKGLPKDIIAAVKPVFARLSEDTLLERCLDGKTENQNECLNGMIWDRVPKQVFVGARVLSLGVYDAVAHFNIGANATIKVLERMNIKPGFYCREMCKDADRKRVKLANYKEDDKSKKRRKILRGKRKRHSDKNQEKGATYLPGEF